MCFDFDWIFIFKSIIKINIISMYCLQKKFTNKITKDDKIKKNHICISKKNMTMIQMETNVRGNNGFYDFKK